jgi:hypothetical protein
MLRLFFSVLTVTIYLLTAPVIPQGKDGKATEPDAPQIASDGRPPPMCPPACPGEGD